MKQKIVIALGGNALGNNIEEQRRAVDHTAGVIVDLAEMGMDIIITHGNGPQVGMIQRAMDGLALREPDYVPVTLPFSVAMSQGYIGIDLQNAIKYELLKRGMDRKVSTILSQIEVDPEDPAFENPTKPIGNFLTEEEARRMEQKCMMGQMTVEECRHYKDKNDISVYDAMKEYGLVPEHLEQAAWPEGSIGHYIELHIEQGPVLDAEKTELGFVDCIVGIQRYIVTVCGRSDHAGTTPMNMRQDAVDIAAKVISRIGDMARAEGSGTVATVGYMKVTPSAMNVVAEKVDFSIDIRSAESSIIDKIASQIQRELEVETQKTGASFFIDTKLTIEPVCLHQGMLDIMEESCRRRGFSFRRMPSGAGHDALAIGQSIDTVMLFVPSKDGRSHCPAEYTPYEDFSKGISVLYDLIRKL